MSNVMNGKLITPQGCPRSMIFDLPSSMINATKLEQRIQPFGQSTYTSAGQTIKFIIPQMDRSFFNSQSLYITANVEMVGADANFGAAANVGDNPYFVLGSYYSLFSRQVISSNGKTLETIEKPSELANALLNMTLNPAERKGLSNSLGYYVDPTIDGDVTLNICQRINTPVDGTTLVNGGRSFTFAIPLLGILNTDKMIPMVNGDWTIELTVNQMTNWLTSSTDAGLALLAGAAGPGFSISELECVVDVLQLTPESYATVMVNYPQKMHIKSSSYDFGTGPIIPTGFSGAVDIPVGIKRSSLKQALIYFAQNNAIDKTYGGVNPNASDLCFITNGTQYPQKPLRILKNPSECYNQVQKSFGSLYSNSHSGSCGKAEFCRRSTASNNYLPALTTAAAGNILVAANKFYLSIDTELINFDSSSLYAGVTMGVNSNFRLNVSTAIPANTTLTPYYWMAFDCIIELDLINGITNIIA